MRDKKMPLRLICITRTTCRWGTELMLWMLGIPVLDQLKLSGSFRVTTCTQTSRPQGEIMLTVKNTKLAFTVQQTFWCMTVSATLLSKISKSFVVVRFVTETRVATHQHLSNGCWDCFSNFWASKIKLFGSCLGKAWEMWLMTVWHRPKR